MICFPNAKVNLGLRITEKRPDGFHNIETVFYPIPVKDALEIVPLLQGGDFRLTTSGINLDSNSENNLVTRAFKLFQQSYSIKKGFDVYLHKAIPSGAGLGGGSSDAAFMLKLLSEETGLNCDLDVLEFLASQLGSDCPFFIKNLPVFATGTGNVFENINVSLKGYYIVLVKPDIHVPTAEAYSNVKPQKHEVSLKTLIEMPLNEWKNIIFNDFETSVFSKFPEIGEIKQKLYDKGAVFALMSGSGSSVYGIFKDEISLKDDFSNCFYWNGYL
jgi:4-diphosphocytidyl-2-C-methyl-D-erythritol kinase